MLPFFGFAYDDKTTHPALTQEIVKFFNQSFPKQKINNSDAELIIKGSTAEDAGIRWMRHFYDPIYNRGLTLSTKEQQLAQISAALQDQTGQSGNWPNAKNWAQNSNLQAGLAGNLSAGLWQNYFSSPKDYSWERSIYEYAWKDKGRGLAGLGHILHLLEDMAVPDHTRNDPHPPILDMGSPYEGWTIKFSRENISIDPEEKPIILSDLNQYFNTVANYSNNNFFSKDTIFTKEYSNPTITTWKEEKLGDGLNYNFGYSRNGSRLIVQRIKDWHSAIEKEFIINDPDDLILSDYWSLLSKQAVLNGAGVIKLFFDEAEKEKQTKILYEKNKSWLGKQLDKFKNAASGLAGIIFGTTENVENQQAAPQEQEQNKEMTAIINPPEKPRTEIKPSPVNTAPAAAVITPIADIKPISTSTPTQIPIPTSIPVPTPDVQASASSEGSPGWSYQLASNPNAATPTNPILTSAPTTTSTSTPTPTPNPTPTPTPEPTPEPDTTPPNLSFTIAECGQSLSADTCLVATTTINLSWSSTSTDLARYHIICESKSLPCPSFDFASTTATSTIYNLVDNASYIFQAKAIDSNENQSPEKIISVEINLRPIVINEIAWMGTSRTKTQDEWIELYNPTFYPVSLEGISLVSETDPGGPDIQLSGAIPARGFYLIERTDDTVISDITASTTASFGNGLSNNGEVLALKYGSTALDRTPAPDQCSGWCGGLGNPYFLSMERVDPLIFGEDKNNWGNSNSLLTNGKNKDNLAINGTPGRRNSLHYLIDKSFRSLDQDKTLKKMDSPYVVASNDLTIKNGVTLTIEPGVVIKFYNEASSLVVEGLIKAEGTAEEPIIFTSLKDDYFGGDTNQDGTSTSPQAGDWAAVKITGSGSVLDNTIFRYGGVKDHTASAWANLIVENAEFSLKNSIIEEAAAYGAWFKNASGQIENNTIRNNNREPYGTGLMVQGGTLDIKNNNFNNNHFGLRLTNSPDETGIFNILNNQFSQNRNYPIGFSDAYPYFSGNVAINNGQNGIRWEGPLRQDYTPSPDLPYIIDNTVLNVLADKTLTILPGTIIKLMGLGSMYVRGKLLAEGTPSQKIIFTSLRDDDCGIAGGCGDTNASTTSPAPGDWSNLSFFSTSTVSTLNNVNIRYGGSKAIFTSKPGALLTDGASLEISHAIFENNYLIGARLENSASTTIRDSIFKNHLEPSSNDVIGLNLFSSSPFIQNTTFENNKTGIFAYPNSSIINGGGIQFINNTTNTTPADLIP